MALNELIEFPEIVPVIAGSGVQFLDFGFSIGKTTPVPQEWGVDDPMTQLNNDQPPRLVRRGDEEPTGRESYSLDLRALVDMFDRVWMPVPLFRRELAGGFFRGPLNWARAYLARLAEPDSEGNTYRLVLALDTQLLEFVETDAYLAPSPADARNGRPFALPGHDEPIDWFYREPWVKDWCLEVFREMVEREERKRSKGYSYKPPTDDELHRDHMQGSNEHIARYRCWLDLVHSLGILPAFVFVDRVTEPRPAPIDVDFVLDLGNSRSCGLMVESEPDQIGVDITRSVKLQLRDLSQPEQVYVEPFPSRFEFARAQFGRDHLSLRSGRSEAFAWPTVVRVGNEAARLASRRRGTEGASGLSSPKRYLWDGDPRRDSWRFNSPAIAGEQSELATGVAFTTYVNDAGEAIHRIQNEPDATPDQLFPSISARYSRQSLTAFALAEIFVQAIAMMNAPMHRLRRPANAQLPRRLRRIILTMPTAMPLAERLIFEGQTEAARDLAYLSLQQAEIVHDANGARIVFKPDARPFAGSDRGPEVILQWDEATATQAVYLYTQVALNYSGDARAFFDNVRHPVNQADPKTQKTLRIATIDLGGGTTDLVITALDAEGRGAHVTLLPKEVFREGFSIAGDDALLRIAREHVIEPIRKELKGRGMGERADFALNQLLGADRGDIKAVELVRRQQFASQIAAPIALGMVHEYEAFDALLPWQVSTRGFNEFFAPDNRPSEELVRYFNQELDKHGAKGFDLRQMQFDIDAPALDRTVRSVFREMLEALAEVVWRYRSDLLILSGRASRLPAVQSILRECCPLAPHRIVPLHSFRVGQWYPFRDYRATVSDPKTTAAVGAMICLLGNGQLHNFNFRSNELRPRSTARYFGKLDRNRLLKDDAFFDNLDLDAEGYEMPVPDAEKEEFGHFQFRGPMALGFRQVAVDWWPASQLYDLDYANPEIAGRLNAQTPLWITLKRERQPRKGMRTEGMEISTVTNSKGRPIPNSRDNPSLRLRLLTISHQQGYWLDTGVLFER